ncbi:MAG: AMP-binding enzyme family protein [Candidatus Rokubacteria bacterium]|nr:AMP-binding enzyme family protein [Candidatus Rokubacteria bacterium]
MSVRPKSRTLGDLLDEMAAGRPHAQALAFRHEQLSYAALHARVDELARALVAVGVTHGDRVAVLLPNRPEWVVAALAIAKIGGIVAAISTFSTARELGWTLEHSEAVALITVSAFRGRAYLDALHDLCPELAGSAPGALRSERLPSLRTVVSMDGRRVDGVFQPEDFLALGTGVGTAALRESQRSVSPDDVCYILYTSGSTAMPKGVTLAHGGVIENGFNIGERQHLTPADRLWLAVPLFWSFGSANALPAILTHGGCAVLQESFEPGEALELLERERCSVYYGMANMARAMLEHPDRSRRRLDSMRTGLTIGLAEDIAMTMEAVGARELCNVYGSTETYGNCAVTDAHDLLASRLHTQGLPLPGMDIRVADPETGRPLQAGEVGELCVAGHVTPGYFRAPELTAAAFDGEGYFHTGDLGLVGDDGRVRFRGRLKEMIKTGGINVAPLEVEGVLLQHPDVKQAYVIGVPDRDKDEVVAAVLELHEDAAADAGAIVAFCRERLASYKVPTRLVFRKGEELPRTPTGKIHKPGLREQLAQDPRS